MPKPEKIPLDEDLLQPTVAQGKRIIYRSIDPAEPKRQRIVRLIFLAMIVLVIGTAAWLDH